MGEHLKKVKHDYIRYANCWEDADILLDALKIETGDRVLSIGSAGDNSFSLLTGNPEFVVAVDINQVQLNLIELKKAAFKALDYEEFVQFLGSKSCHVRWDLFLKVSPFLSQELTDFWTERKFEIEVGIINQGKFEKYFSYFKRRILPLVHNKKRIIELFENKDEELQKQFFIEKWNNKRWQMLFKIFFSRFVLGRFGRDPKFLNEVKIPVSEFIFNQAKAHLSSVYCQKNYFLQYILTGKFRKDLPHYARKENFESIKKRIDKIIVHKGFAEDVFEKYDGINKFNLSNIFEYMNQENFAETADIFLRNSLPKSVFAYWNLMVPRKMSEIDDSFIYEKETSQILKKIDKGFFYSNFIVERKL